MKILGEWKALLSKVSKKVGGIPVVFILILCLSISIYGGHVHSSNNTTGSAYYNAKSLPEWEKARHQVTQRVQDVLGEVPYKIPNPNVSIISTVKIDGYIMEKLSYSVSDQERVNAYLLIPSDHPNQKKPAILALHQTAANGKNQVVGVSDNELDMHYGLELVKRGYIVMAPDAPFAGERLEQGESAYDTKKFYEKYPKWSALGKALTDNEVAVDVLSKLPIVDANKIGVIGHSQGGVDALFLGAFDKQVDVVVVSCGLGLLEGDPHPEKWYRYSGWVGLPKLKENLQETDKYDFDFSDLVALTAPKPFLSFSATDDYVFNNYKGIYKLRDYVSPIYKLYHSDEKLNLRIFSGQHSFPSENRDNAYQWLDHYLKE